MHLSKSSDRRFWPKRPKNAQGRFVQKCHDKTTAKRPNFVFVGHLCHRKTTASDLELQKKKN